MRQRWMMKTLLRLVGFALFLGMTAVWLGTNGCSIDGDTYGVRLVNDTQGPLEYQYSGRKDLVKSGGSVRQNAMAGHLSWWKVRNAEGEVLGCLPFDYPRSSAKTIVRYVSLDLVPCPVASPPATKIPIRTLVVRYIGLGIAVLTVLALAGGVTLWVRGSRSR